jgi:hypothetical protein
MAIAITHRKGKEVSAVVLGCNDEDMKSFQSAVLGTTESEYLFILMWTFLELERDRRINEMPSLTGKVDSIFRKYCGSEVPENHPRRYDMEGLIEIQPDVSRLRNVLSTWKIQLLRMRGWEEDFVSHPDRRDSARKLQRLVDEYEAHIGRCDTLLQTAALALQMVRPFFPQKKVILTLLLKPPSSS